MDSPNYSRSAAFELHEHLEASSQRRMAAATAAKLQQRKRGAAKETLAIEPVVKVIASNLHNIGTASSLGKNRPTEEALRNFAAAEKLRLENQTLSRRLDRLGRETKELRESFVTVAKQQWESGSQGPVGAWKLQSAQSVAEMTIAAKVKEEEIKVREDMLHFKESEVQSKEAFLLSNIRDVSQSGARLKVQSSAQQQREEELQREIESLKSLIFKMKQNKDFADSEHNVYFFAAEAQRGIQPSKIPIKAKSYQNYLKQKGFTVGNKSIDEHQHEQSREECPESNDNKQSNSTEHISVPRSEYETLVKDFAAQETLIEGFQRENEKLAQRLREREAEENARIAIYFDTQEKLNKEINRLKNLCGVDGVSFAAFEEYPLGGTAPGNSLTRRSLAGHLRSELEVDAVVRGLQDRLAVAESGMGDREKELKIQVEKLKQTNRELLLEIKTAAKSIGREDTSRLQYENRELREEVVQLTRKLEWYAGNQPLIDRIEDEKEAFRRAVHALQKELVVKQGVDARTVQRILTSAIAKEEHELQNDRADKSFSSSSSPGATAKSSRRSPADVKKIKMLELQVRELQDNLLKRNPNSVASLIRAVAVTDAETAATEKDKLWKEEVESLQQVLQEEREAFDRKLRSLRQQHEGLKQQYEGRLRSLEGQLRAVGADSDGGQNEKTIKRNGDVKIIKNMTHALARIRELEDNTERLKSFYQKKIDEGNKRFNFQIEQLKQQHPPEQGGEVSSFEDLKRFYSERISLLESELMLTAEELGQMKRAHMDTALAQSESNRVNHHKDSLEAALTANAQMDAALKATSVEVEALRTRVKTLQEENQSLKLISERSEHQLALTTDRLRFAEQQSSSCRMEVAALSSRLADALQQPNSPQLAMFVSLESQLRHVEERLQRREKDLMAAIEDGKATATLEQSRMLALHAQELHEKDEQLRRFQEDLQQLVQALRVWHQQQEDEESSHQQSSGDKKNFGDVMLRQHLL